MDGNVITMRLNNTGVFVDIVDGKKRQSKFLTLQNFQSCISREFCLDTGLLPVGTIAFKLHQDRKRLAMIRSAGIKSVKYELSDEGHDIIKDYIVPIPALLWIFEMNLRNIILDTRVFAVKTELITPNIHVFNVPLSNVYDDGRVCWGDKDFLREPLRSLVGLASLPDVFFSRAFNRDLDVRRNGLFALDFFQQYDKKEIFPAEILQEWKTFKEVWQ